MTDAAILATFSDFALVRSRKVARLIFEVPIEQAKKALDTLGMPDPAGETWCGIARVQKLKSTSLGDAPTREDEGHDRSATHAPVMPAPSPNPTGPNPSLTTGPAEGGAAHKSAATAPPSPKRKWDQLSPREQAVLRCDAAVFQQWLGVSTAADAAAQVRQLCGVASRRELDTDPAKGTMWRHVDSDFKRWRMAQ